MLLPFNLIPARKCFKDFNHFCCPKTGALLSASFFPLIILDFPFPPKTCLSKIVLSKGYGWICCITKALKNLINTCGGCNTRWAYVGGFLTLVRYRIFSLPLPTHHLIHSLSRTVHLNLRYAKAAALKVDPAMVRTGLIVLHICTVSKCLAPYKICALI